jgi:hypothetical protein
MLRPPLPENGHAPCCPWRVRASPWEGQGTRFRAYVCLVRDQTYLLTASPRMASAIVVSRKEGIRAPEQELMAPCIQGRQRPCHDFRR